MPQNDKGAVLNMGDYQRRPTSSDNGGLNSGDGGGTFDPMEPRVKALEDKFEKMDTKLDSISADLGFIKGQLSTLPSATTFGQINRDLGKVEGHIDRLPTMSKAVGLTALATGVVTLALKWSAFLVLFGK